MSALDIFVIVLLGGGAMIGFVRGLVHEVFSLLAWVVAIVVLRLFHSPVSEALTGAVGTATAGAVLAFVLLFLPSFLFMKLLARSIGKRSRSSMLGPFDRVLGGGLRNAQGPAGGDPVLPAGQPRHRPDLWTRRAKRPDWMRNSRTYPLLNASGRAVVDWVETRRKGSAATHRGKRQVIRLYDTMTREKRRVRAADPKRITMYVCGPTVYGRAHIGNARPAVVFDLLARLLRHEFGEKASSTRATSRTWTTRSSPRPRRKASIPRSSPSATSGFYLEDMGALGVIPPDHRAARDAGNPPR